MQFRQCSLLKTDQLEMSGEGLDSGIAKEWREREVQECVKGPTKVQELELVMATISRERPQ